MVQYAWSGASKRASELSDHASQKLNAKFAEVTEGLATIRGFCWQGQMLQQLLGATQESEAAVKVTLSLQPWFEMSLALCWTVIATNMVAYTFCHLDEVSPNMLGVCLLSLFTLPTMAKNLLSITFQIKELMAGTDRIRRFLMASEQPAMAGGLDPTTKDKDWGEIPEIVFDNAEIGANA